MLLVVLKVLLLGSLIIRASNFFTATQNSFLHSTETHSRLNQRSTLIDPIFRSVDQSIAKVINASPLPLGKSHHKISKFKYLFKCSLYHGKIHSLYHGANFNSTKKDLPLIDWPWILDICDTTSCWERFLNTINFKIYFHAKAKL